MKTFLITITILGSIIYGMLEINEYYDDRGACSWGLFSGGDYRHKERLKNALEGLIKDIIKQDKKSRRELLKNQGFSEKEIAKKIKALEPQYNREREKIVKYCYLDFEKEPYFQKKSMRVKPSPYCEIGNGNNGGNSGDTSYHFIYNFDKESMNFFNEVIYIDKLKDKLFHMRKFVGIEYHTGYYPCKTKYQGLGETGYFLVENIGNISAFDKTKHVKF